MQSACAISLSVACGALHYFTTLSYIRHDFRKKGMEHKMRILIFFTTFARKISHSKKKWATYDHKCILTFMHCAHNSCHVLMKIEFSKQMFEKYSNTKFDENLSSGTQLVASRRIVRQTDRHDEANRRFSQLCELN
jgi:hypothetical protein